MRPLPFGKPIRSLTRSQLAGPTGAPTQTYGTYSATDATGINATRNWRGRFSYYNRRTVSGLMPYETPTRIKRTMPKSPGRTGMSGFSIVEMMISIHHRADGRRRTGRACWPAIRKAARATGPAPLNCKATGAYALDSSQTRAAPHAGYIAGIVG